MPIYAYQCEACDKTCELLQKVSDAPATQCPHCHAHKLKKQITAAAFHLKGSGWYVTDFKDKPKDSTEKTQDKSDKTTDNKDSGKSTAQDSKPDGKKAQSD